MVKKIRDRKTFDNDYREYGKRWAREYYNEHSKEPSREEIIQAMLFWMEINTRKMDHTSMMTFWNASKAEGLFRSMGKSPTKNRDGEVFDQAWADSFISTPDGYIPAPKASLEHMKMQKERLDKAIEKAERKAAAQQERNDIAEPGFAAPGVETCEEALKVQGVEPCRTSEEAQTTFDFEKE